MKISTKGRYGIQLMLDLAIHYNQQLVPLKDIASRQEISEKYLEQIITPLNKSGYVRSVRGSQGGYMLALEPSKITIGMLLRVLEGPLYPVDCAATDNPNCDRASTCVTIGIWKKMKEAVESVVDNISLEDLVEEYKSKIEPDFCI
ncbi:MULTISPECIES: RrF2 family transcriptional regulator [Clostridium]|uniref:Rrf2 family transcriptional regulator n=1 Tax=Clostridium paridis TaxID=2803863 RepID=A0A937K4R6_9CLOT|nr:MULTISPECIES: Rrf2 family transcriptional regulator [Clostridium]MBL4933566.1 Rrf2 family transcriptional regulator [Clostridium paridis]MDD7796356.1 Rrf2 family transcriptional regulator [Clostridium sp. 'White wine YQ']